MKKHKGERCPYDIRIFCQEGDCEGCCIYHHYSSEKYKKTEGGNKMQNGKVKDIELVYHGYRISLSTLLLQIALWLLVAECFGLI